MFSKNLSSLKNNHLNLINKIDFLIDENEKTEETSFINSIFEVDPLAILFFFGYKELTLTNVISFIEDIRHVILDDGEIYLKRKPHHEANKSALRILTALNKVDQFKKSYFYSVSDTPIGDAVYLDKNKIKSIFSSINDFKTNTLHLNLLDKEDKKKYWELSKKHTININSLFD